MTINGGFSRNNLIILMIFIKMKEMKIWKELKFIIQIFGAKEVQVFFVKPENKKLYDLALKLIDTI